MRLATLPFTIFSGDAETMYWQMTFRSYPFEGMCYSAHDTTVNVFALGVHYLLYSGGSPHVSRVLSRGSLWSRATAVEHCRHVAV